ncbi:hypothetical protein ABIC99_003750 [Sphaerotilus sulfidivorans]|jgi:hypothetical protein|uniref:DUF2933 domain-containing protein n=1 Tax=Sphaerotilus sulfidivorans TaxID=639200 RepID=A0A5C1Q7E3_9BURK|nr:DUF2933 domain-containing protein [Sphaerotilus sulfidivorans]NZD47544.1 DUF2933 domain-containing protein [Sphaerotilus sulfidivorans]QEN02826.1 DUF2933 domain-containing protein [Sphaerotilus sulfidivorans]
MNDLDLRDTPPPFWRSRLGLGWLALAAVAGWFLLTEHRAHLFGALPWLVLLACPLMHVFMHGRHHHGRHGHGPSADRAPAAGRSTSDPSGDSR